MKNGAKLPTDKLVASLQKNVLTRKEKSAANVYQEINDRLVQELTSKKVVLGSGGEYVSKTVDDILVETPTQNLAELRGDMDVFNQIKQQLDTVIDNDDERSIIAHKLDAAIEYLQKKSSMRAVAGEAVKKYSADIAGIGVAFAGDIGLGFAIPVVTKLIQGRKESRKKKSREQLQQLTGSPLGVKQPELPTGFDSSEDTPPSSRRGSIREPALGGASSVMESGTIEDNGLLGQLVQLNTQMASDIGDIRAGVELIVEDMAGDTAREEISRVGEAESAREGKSTIASLAGGAKEKAGKAMGWLKEAGFGVTDMLGSVMGMITPILLPLAGIAALIGAAALVWMNQDWIEDQLTVIFMAASEKMTDFLDEKLAKLGGILGDSLESWHDTVENFFDTVFGEEFTKVWNNVVDAIGQKLAETFPRLFGAHEPPAGPVRDFDSSYENPGVRRVRAEMVETSVRNLYDDAGVWMGPPRPVVAVSAPNHSTTTTTGTVFNVAADIGLSGMPALMGIPR